MESFNGYGSNTVEPEINTKIKKKFEEAIQYFTKIIQLLITSSYNHGGAELNKSNINEAKILELEVKRKNKNLEHNINNNSSSGEGQSFYSPDSSSPIEPTPIMILGNSSYSSSSSSEDGSIHDPFLPNRDDYDEILSQPDNHEILTTLIKGMWKKSYRYRENLYFSLSTVQESIVVEQLIDQSFGNFVDDCYMEIINKFEDSHSTYIDLLKLTRSTPDKIMDGKIPRLEKYLPPNSRFNTDQPRGSTDEIKLFIKKIYNQIFQVSFIIKYLLSLFPIHWVKKYKLNYLKDDIIASLTIGFMLIPQAMAYAILAGLPPIYGLYSAFISPIVYGIFGTSNEISVGPVAMVSLLIPSIIDHAPGSPDYIIDAICLSLLSGLILFTFGVFKAGFIIETLLSNPILLGFIQAGAILIMFSQMKNFTGIPIPSNATSIIDFMRAITHDITLIKGPTVLMGAIGLIILLIGKYVNTKIRYKIPTPVLILIFGTLISYLVDVHEKYHIKIVDTIPSGIPTPTAVPLTVERISKMFVGSAILSILGFVESISIGKKFASARKYNIDSSQELIALGMCNMITSVFQGYPTTGSFSRTVVCYQCGSKSKLTSILTGLIVMVVLLLLTPVFKYTPLCLLASIVLVAAISLLEPMEVVNLYKRGEILGFLQLIFVFLCTLLLGSETGIIIAFCVSIFQIIFFSSRPNLVVLGRLPGTLVFRNVIHYPNAIQHPGVMVLRYDSRMTYYTINHFRDSMSNLNLSPPNSQDITILVIDLVNVSSIDSTAIDVLNDMLDSYESNGITILWTDLRSNVKSVMTKSGFLKRISTDHIFTNTSSAVDYAVTNKKEHFQVDNV